MIESDETINSPTLTFLETEKPRPVGACVVEKDKVRLEDKERLITTIKAPREASVDLAWDPFFHKKGIVTEPGSLLISQGETQKLWGKPVGTSPEDFLANYKGDVLGVCPSNANWQLGAFLIKEGEVFSPDRNLTGPLETIGLTKEGWTSRVLDFEDGKPINPSTIAQMRVGFSMPLILKEGQVVPLEGIIGDPRLTADLRNVVDFADGKKLPSDFWLLLRRLLPASGVAGKRLIKERSVVVRREGAMTDEEIQKFQQIIRDNNLTTLALDVRQKAPRLVFRGKLPIQRIPVVGVGYDNKGQLIVTAVDGRQEGSAGASISELAEIMQAKGAVTAGLGCAGGDVTVVLKTKEGAFEILNSPSNLDKDRNRVTRLEPSQLVLR